MARIKLYASSAFAILIIFSTQANSEEQSTEELPTTSSTTSPIEIPKVRSITYNQLGPDEQEYSNAVADRKGYTQHQPDRHQNTPGNGKHYLLSQGMNQKFGYQQMMPSYSGGDYYNQYPGGYNPMLGQGFYQGYRPGFGQGYPQFPPWYYQPQYPGLQGGFTG